MRRETSTSTGAARGYVAVTGVVYFALSIAFLTIPNLMDAILSPSEGPYLTRTQILTRCLPLLVLSVLYLAPVSRSARAPWYHIGFVITLAPIFATGWLLYLIITDPPTGSTAVAVVLFLVMPAIMLVALPAVLFLRQVWLVRRRRRADQALQAVSGP